MIYATLLASWLFFGFVHSLLAAGRVKRFAQVTLGPRFRYYRLGYNLVALLTFLPVLYLDVRAPAHWLWTPTLWSTAVGGLLLLAGLGITGVALRGYDLREFAGWPPLSESDNAGTLQQGGLLRYVRHPLYLGIGLALAGRLFLQPTGASLLFLTAALLYIRVGIYFEEKKLVQTFGDSYRAYRHRVPMLLPFRRAR